MWCVAGHACRTCCLWGARAEATCWLSVLHALLLQRHSCGNVRRTQVPVSLALPELQPRFSCAIRRLPGAAPLRLPHALQASQAIKKQRLSAAGKPVADVEHHDVTHTRKSDINKTSDTACGSCYGAESTTLPCCNTCEEVSRHQAQHAGCAEWEGTCRTA